MRSCFKRWVACLLIVLLAATMGLPAFAAEDGMILCTDPHEAAVALRDEMVKRREVISVAFPGESDDIRIATDIINESLAHTGVPVHGDYLRFGVRKCFVDLELLQDQGVSLIKLTYTLTYYTTAEQEKKLDTAIEALLTQLDVYNSGEYEKVCAIYDYICENITYDSWGALTGDKLVYSAYAALVHKMAVCQGYATLFYRLALELGLDARMITGTSGGQSHGWNIVRIGACYYNVDSTWDAKLAQKNQPYQYFLCSNDNFGEHNRKASYSTETFMALYPIAKENYDISKVVTPGELNGDGYVDEEDAIYLLQYVLMPAEFPVYQFVDYTADGRVDEEDAIYLLQYVLMPENFPLQRKTGDS